PRSVALAMRDAATDQAVLDGEAVQEAAVRSVAHDALAGPEPHGSVLSFARALMGDRVGGLGQSQGDEAWALRSGLAAEAGTSAAGPEASLPVRGPGREIHGGTA